MFTTLTKAAVAAVLGTTMLLGAGTAASAAPATPEPAVATEQCTFGEHLLHAWLRLPADLRGDLTAIRDLPTDERPEAMRDVRQDALDGQYGDEVQAGAERLKERRLAAWSTMPADLRADLIELRRAAPEERRELAQVIAESALAGEYGEKAQATAQRVQEYWQQCAPQ